MRIRDLTQRSVMTADISESLSAAASRMRLADVSALPVTREGEPVGILTERDLTRAVADAVNPLTTGIATYMTLGLTVAKLDDESEEVAARMLELGIRHLPVQEAGELVGIISMRDLLLLEALRPRAAARLE
ncbi:MAG TPA: CBS domain-containing protein [Candidatus Limnocylindrales bacterium]|nr:CBS domain-containing protein [Candidatus Limnocylindrales bacterium]